jgi:metalloendopeptidase OMA1, mitochondrial
MSCRSTDPPGAKLRNSPDEPNFGCAVAACMSASFRALIGFALIASAAFLGGCYTVPETGRQSLVLVPPDQEAALGAQAFTEIRTQERVSNDPVLTARVERVGQRIAQAVGNDMPGTQWEFVVFDSPDVNAFALPGGKVGVYTGLLQLATSDDELAAVIGHEIAHVTARHAGERMTQASLLGLGQSVVGGGVASRYGESASQLFKVVSGATAAVGVVLPHSRRNELEADEIGLRYAARAGYDPRAAIAFWLKMNQQGQGNSMPSFLRTHPTGDDRIARLNELMAEALPLYEAALRGSGAAEIGRPIGSGP